jgi:hypothetical protein
VVGCNAEKTRTERDINITVNVSALNNIEGTFLDLEPYYSAIIISNSIMSEYNNLALDEAGFAKLAFIYEDSIDILMASISN